MKGGEKGKGIVICIAHQIINPQPVALDSVPLEGVGSITLSRRFRFTIHPPPISTAARMRDLHGLYTITRIAVAYLRLLSIYEIIGVFDHVTRGGACLCPSCQELFLAL